MTDHNTSDDDQQGEDDPGARARALSERLGAAPLDYARVAALERLSELRASGAMSQEDYDREKRRLAQ